MVQERHLIGNCHALDFCMSLPIPIMRAGQIGHTGMPASKGSF